MAINSPAVNATRGVVLINLQVLCMSVGMLCAKFIYVANPRLQPYQLLCVRGFVSSAFSVLYVNKNLKNAIWNDLPPGCLPMLVKRCVQGVLTIFITFTIVKYLSLIYVSLAQNMVPVV